MPLPKKLDCSVLIGSQHSETVFAATASGVLPKLLYPGEGGAGYTDCRNRSAQVPIHGRGSGLSSFTGNQSVKDVSERSVNDFVELYTFQACGKAGEEIGLSR